MLVLISIKKLYVSSYFLQGSMGLFLFRMQKFSVCFYFHQEIDRGVGGGGWLSIGLFFSYSLRSFVVVCMVYQ